MNTLNLAIDYIGQQFIGFIVGVASSVFASIAYARMETKSKRKKFGSLVDVWVEANTSLADRPLSICEFFFSASDGKLKFEGYSYDNHGNEYYKWWSVVLRIDDKERRMPYVYETQKVGETAKDEGFGCVFFHQDESNDSWNAERGYFLDLEEAKPRHTHMLKFDDVAKKLKLDIKKHVKADRQRLIRELLEPRNAQELKKLFGWE